MAYRINARSKKRLVLGAGIAILALAISFPALTAFPHYGHYLVLAISVTLISVGTYQGIGYARAGRWTPAEATVLDIREEWIDVILHYSALKHYYPAIRYQYAFQGVSYISSTVSFDVENIWVPEFDSWGMKTDNTARFWNGWAQGTTITAYVDTRNPSKAVIINKMTRNARSQQLAFIAGGVIIGILWLYLVYL